MASTKEHRRLEKEKEDRHKKAVLHKTFTSISTPLNTKEEIKAWLHDFGIEWELPGYTSHNGSFFYDGKSLGDILRPAARINLRPGLPTTDPLGRVFRDGVGVLSPGYLESLKEAAGDFEFKKRVLKESEEPVDQGSSDHAVVVEEAEGSDYEETVAKGTRKIPGRKAKAKNTAGKTATKSGQKSAVDKKQAASKAVPAKERQKSLAEGDDDESDESEEDEGLDDQRSPQSAQQKKQPSKGRQRSQLNALDESEVEDEESEEDDAIQAKRLQESFAQADDDSEDDDDDSDDDNQNNNALPQGDSGDGHPKASRTKAGRLVHPPPPRKRKRSMASSDDDDDQYPPSTKKSRTATEATSSLSSSPPLSGMSRPVRETTVPKDDNSSSDESDETSSDPSKVDESSPERDSPGVGDAPGARGPPVSLERDDDDQGLVDAVDNANHEVDHEDELVIEADRASEGNDSGHQPAANGVDSVDEESEPDQQPIDDPDPAIEESDDELVNNPDSEANSADTNSPNTPPTTTATALQAFDFAIRTAISDFIATRAGNSSSDGDESLIPPMEAQMIHFHATLMDHAAHQGPQFGGEAFLSLLTAFVVQIFRAQQFE